MEQNMFNLNNKIYSNNNNLLLEIVNDINQVINNSKEDLSIKILGNVINKINYIINENKKNLQLLRNDISSMCNQMNKRFDKLEINNINNQEIKFSDGKYIGQVVNGSAEGKGTWYGTKEPFIGDRYEGEWRNDKKEGKGIYYVNNGDRIMGDYYNDDPIGKHVRLTKNGGVKIENY